MLPFNTETSRRSAANAQVRRLMGPLGSDMALSFQRRCIMSTYPPLPVLGTARDSTRDLEYSRTLLIFGAIFRVATGEASAQRYEIA